MIRLDNVSVTFNPDTPNAVRALRNFSLTVPDRQFVTVIGSNGAGKSTLFNVIAGSVQPERGTITLDGSDVTDWSEPRRSSKIGRVFQNPALGTCPGLTIRENLSLALKRGKRLGLSRGVKSHHTDLFYERLKEIGMGLEHRLDADVSLLSGGQRQAVTLVMATISEPKLLLLDEHTAALDPNAARQIIDLTIKLAQTHHLTVIMITHSMYQAVDLRHRIIMMNRGELLFSIEGDDLNTLTVPDLVERFRSLRAEDELTDRTMLE